MQFTYTGTNSSFLEQSFFDGNGVLSIETTSASPTEVVLTHTVYTAADVFVTLKGTGLAVNVFGALTAGQITSIEFNGLDIRQATITDINWSASALQDALFDFADSGDVSGVVDLFNSSGPITIDASNGLSAFDQERTWDNFLPLITQPITFIGSRFDDSVAGSSQDDVIDTRRNQTDGDRISASEGDDLFIFDIEGSTQSVGYYLDYDLIDAGMTFEIDGKVNTGDATGAGFTDTYQNVLDALGTYLGIEGTPFADTFDITLAADQAVSMIGGAGADSYTLDAEGAQPILDFFFNTVTSGLDLNVNAGIIADDGFGNAETLDITGIPDTLILLATDNDDRIVDGPGDQLVRFYDGDDVFHASNLGNDSVDGSIGSDLVVFETVSQGQTTLTFNGAVTTLTDRSNPGNSTALVAVETIETEGDVTLELAKHDGIGLISNADLVSLTELYIAYFNRAADALGLSFWATAFQKNGFSLREIADLFFTQPETQSLYSGVSDGAFVQAVYNNVLGRDADAPGFSFWTGQLAAGNITESGFILELLAGARAATGDPADVAYIEAKTDIGLYFAVGQGQNNLADARDVMNAFDGSADSIAEALSRSDDAFIDALTSDTELLMPVLGVIDISSDSIA